MATLPDGTVTPSDFLAETMRAVHAHLAPDQARWGDTWLKRTRNGQEKRTLKNILRKYQDFFKTGKPADELSMIGDLHINLIRRNHPDLSETWNPRYPETTVMPDNLAPVLLPGEAIMAFCAWLTTLRKPLAIGEKYAAGDLAELAGAFCKANNLYDVEGENGDYTFVTPEDPRLSIFPQPPFRPD